MSLCVWDRYQLGVVGVHREYVYMCWVFCIAVPFVSIYGVVLPVVTIVIPSVIKRVSIYLFEVMKSFNSGAESSYELSGDPQ